jgi:hypothetical protein
MPCHHQPVIAGKGKGLNHMGIEPAVWKWANGDNILVNEKWINKNSLAKSENDL